MENTPAVLIEPGAKYFLNNTLKECNKFKEKHISFLFNVGMAIAFGLVCFVLLYFRYKGNIDPAETRLKERQKKEYIMSKLIQLSDIKRKTSQDRITNLPDWSNNPEVQILNRR
jgi:hypothetical protein